MQHVLGALHINSFRETWILENPMFPVLFFSTVKEIAEVLEIKERRGKAAIPSLLLQNLSIVTWVNDTQFVHRVAVANL